MEQPADARPFDSQIKLLMIGDNGVGKTCILVRFANDSFNPNALSTIGIDYKLKVVLIDGKRVKLHVWDTAGQERFRTITTSYFRGAQGILLTYDITDRSTFNSVTNWLAQIQQFADVNVNKVLIGNKIDMEDQRAVSFEEGEDLARDYNMLFFEVSAKENINIDETFLTVARNIKRREEGLDDVDGKIDGGIKLQAGSPSGGDGGGGCCHS